MTVMGRIVLRVPLDFDSPLGEVWPGYLMPSNLQPPDCPVCGGSGYSPRGEELRNLWYGYVPFRPEDNGSVPFTSDHPAIMECAKRNIARSPEFYGIDKSAYDLEVRRLTLLFNSRWRYHLNADDVFALLEADRLWSLTRKVISGKWVTVDPPPVITPDDVNTWNIESMGHDSLNAMICIKARCLREGQPYKCDTCQGHGTVEEYPGQRADADAWEREEPPTGPGWQLWSTTTEGHPMTPVFASAGELAEYCAEEGVSTFGSDTADAEWWLSFISGKEIGVEISPGVIAI